MAGSAGVWRSGSARPEPGWPLSGATPRRTRRPWPRWASWAPTRSVSRRTSTAEADCQGLVERTLAHFGRVDILVNNAGINIRKQPQDYTLAEWHAIIDGNLTSAFLCAKAIYPALLEAGGGKIINNASLSAILGIPFAAPYGASKGGIVQLTRSLATAWAKDNIQVNAVLPGWVDTDLTRQARIDVPGLHDRVISRTPAQRWGTPEDFAGIAVFLASSASDYVTGAAIPIDGGYAIQP